MPYEYEDEAEIYRTEPTWAQLVCAFGWGVSIGILGAAAIILIVG